MNSIATLLPALPIALVMSQPVTEANFLVVAINFLPALLTAVVMVYLYRSRGFAAAWLVLTVSALLTNAATARSVGDPNFVLQSNLMVLSVTLLLAVGVWGYVGERVRQKLAAAGIG